MLVDPFVQSMLFSKCDVSSARFIAALCCALRKVAAVAAPCLRALMAKVDALHGFSSPSQSALEAKSIDLMSADISALSVKPILRPDAVDLLNSDITHSSEQWTIEDVLGGTPLHLLKGLTSPVRRFAKWSKEECNPWSPLDEPSFFVHNTNIYLAKVASAAYPQWPEDLMASIPSDVATKELASFITYLNIIHELSLELLVAARR